jgi:DNA-binding transcriptional LysR family regulator
MFDLKQIRCFVAVGEELHFGRAARRMHMTQPPLSRQIQLLEHELGVQLLARTNRSVKLTAAGELFLQESRRLVAHAANAATSALRVARGESGQITLGFTAGAGYSFLPRLLTRINQSQFDIDIVLVEMASEHQTEALSDSSIDIGLLRSPLDLKQFEEVCVSREPLMLAVPQSHRLAKVKMPTLQDLKGEPFIMYSPTEGSYLFELIEGLFKTAAISTHYVQKLSQIHSILALVSAGHGITLVPQSASVLHFDNVLLKKIRLPPVAVELFVAWRRDNSNPSLPRVRELLIRDFAQPNLT